MTVGEKFPIIILGHLNTDLSPTGIKQASELKKHVGHLKPDLFISSDLRRASSVSSFIHVTEGNFSIVLLNTKSVPQNITGRNNSGYISPVNHL